MGENGAETFRHPGEGRDEGSGAAIAPNKEPSVPRATCGQRSE